MNELPVWALFLGTILVVLMAVEAGFRIGKASQKRAEEERVPSVSSMVGAVLGLLAFMLAFTFGMVASRFDARKTLVRDEANAIRTAWLRSDLLPEAEQAGADRLFRDYVSRRLDAVQARDLTRVNGVLVEAARIQDQLWSGAVANARRDMHSPVAALYVESLNEVMRLHALRVAIGLQARIPGMIWLVLYALIILGMLAVGFHTAIAGSRRSWAAPLVALSFSIVIALIASLDQPTGGQVSQRPLADLLAAMNAPPGGVSHAADGD